MLYQIVIFSCQQCADLKNSGIWVESLGKRQAIQSQANIYLASLWWGNGRSWPYTEQLLETWHS